MSARGRAGETLNGTNDPALIKAFGGNDIVNAKDAADDLSCGDGDYELYGQNGNDTYYDGGSGKDGLSEYNGTLIALLAMASRVLM